MYWSPGSGYSEAQSCQGEEVEEEAFQVMEEGVEDHPFLVMAEEGEACLDHKVAVGEVEAYQVLEEVVEEAVAAGVHPALQVEVAVEEGHTEASE